MNDPEFRAYQTRTAALSLFPQLHVKLLPPAWGANGVPSADADKKEWKRRIKMYRMSPIFP